VELTDGASVILRFADADRGVAYPIKSGPDLVGAVFFLLRAESGRRRAPDHLLTLLVRYLIPQIETLYVLEQARHAHVLEERRRIARDLHDNFVQVLAGLGLRVDVLSASWATQPGAEQLAADLADMRATITRELYRVRTYLAEMREPQDGIASLGSLVTEIAAGFASRTGIAVDAAIDPELAGLSGVVVRELAPLLREALTNVEKHAGASRVTVTARRDSQLLTLTVRDNGVGIKGSLEPVAGRPHGQGIVSMRERTRLLGGSLAIEPFADGTTLVASVPIAASV
jgi:signal transduction histidine kinase